MRNLLSPVCTIFPPTLHIRPLEQLAGIRFGLCICFCVDISNLLAPILYARVRFTQIFSRPDKKLHALLHPFLFIIHGGKSSWKSANPDGAIPCVCISKQTSVSLCVGSPASRQRCNLLLIENVGKFR